MDINIRRRTRKIRRRYQIKPHLRDIYKFFLRHGKVQEDMILLESFHGKTVSDSSLVMAREILRLYPGRYRLYFATRDIKAHSAFVKAEGLDVCLISINTAGYMKILAGSRYIISNASLPIYFIRRPGQTYLQTWHGTPLKTLGRSMRLGIESMYNVQHNFLQASHILMPNEFTRRAIMEDYFLEDLFTGKVIMSGYPRNQVFMQPGRSKSLRERLGLAGKTVYAYMPTWRGTSNHTIESDGYFDEVKEIFEKLDKRMTDDQVMYVNFHPIIQGSFDFSGYSHIMPFPKDVDNYTFLSMADLLVTDYSSVFFDFSLTGKPVVLFMYDYEKYIHDRNLYMDIKTLPFRQIFDTDEFIDCIADGEALGDTYQDAEFFRSFFRYDSPDAPEKILKLILEGGESGARICDIESWRNSGGESSEAGDAAGTTDPAGSHEEGLTLIDYSGNRDREWTLYFPMFIDRESDLNTLQQICDEDPDALVIFYRKWFLGREMSRLIYDKYNRIRYVLVTIDTDQKKLKAQVEEEKRLAGASGKTVCADDADGRESESSASYGAGIPLYRNDLRRYLPGIKIKKMLTSGYGVFHNGCQVPAGAVVLTDCVLGNYGPASLDISIKDTKGLIIKETAVLDNKNTIIRRRTPDKAELDSLTFRFDFRKELESCVFPNKRFASAGLLCEDAEGGMKLLKFTEEKRLKGFDPEHKVKRALSYDPMRYSLMLPEGFLERKTGFIYSDQEEGARLTEQEVCVMPVLAGDRSLVFRICSDDKLIEFAGDTAGLTGISLDGSMLTVSAELRGWSAPEVRGMVLKLSSDKEADVIALDCEVSEGDGKVRVKASLNTNREITGPGPSGGGSLRPGYWNICAVMLYGGREYLLKVKSFNRDESLEERLCGIKAVLAGGYTLRPALTDWGTLRFQCKKVKQEPKEKGSLLSKLKNFFRA